MDASQFCCILLCAAIAVALPRSYQSNSLPSPPMIPKLTLHGNHFQHSEIKGGQKMGGHLSLKLPNGQENTLVFEKDHFGYKPELFFTKGSLNVFQNPTSNYPQSYSSPSAQSQGGNPMHMDPMQVLAGMMPGGMMSGGMMPGGMMSGGMMPGGMMSGGMMPGGMQNMSPMGGDQGPLSGLLNHLQMMASPSGGMGGQQGSMSGPQGPMGSIFGSQGPLNGFGGGQASPPFPLPGQIPMGPPRLPSSSYSRTNTNFPSTIEQESFRPSMQMSPNHTPGLRLNEHEESAAKNHPINQINPNHHGNEHQKLEGRNRHAEREQIGQWNPNDYYQSEEYDNME